MADVAAAPMTKEKVIDVFQAEVVKMVENLGLNDSDVTNYLKTGISGPLLSNKTAISEPVIQKLIETGQKTILNIPDFSKKDEGVNPAEIANVVATSVLKRRCAFVVAYDAYRKKIDEVQQSADGSSKLQGENKNMKQQLNDLKAIVEALLRFHTQEIEDGLIKMIPQPGQSQ